MKISRRLPVALVLCLFVSCSDSSPGTPTTPTPPATPLPPPVSLNRWSISGQVVDTMSGALVAGAQLTFGDFGSGSADGDGRFRFESELVSSTATYQVTISAPGYLTRRASVFWQRGERAGLRFDIIREAAPFSLDFYRQFVRDATTRPVGNLRPLRRWTTPPSFYIRTVDETRGRPVEAEVIEVVREWLPISVREWTGWDTPAVETGVETRPPAVGWIRVVFISVSDEDTLCGSSFVGVNPGTITFTLNGCDCGSRKVNPATILHEVGHAMGFWHVDDRRSVMFPFVPGACRDSALSAAERHHAAIAFRRLNGSLDVDDDPIGPPQAQPFGVLIAD